MVYFMVALAIGYRRSITLADFLPARNKGSMALGSVALAIILLENACA